MEREGVDIRQSIIIVVVSWYRVVFALIHRCPDTSFTVAFGKTEN